MPPPGLPLSTVPSQSSSRPLQISGDGTHVPAQIGVAEQSGSLQSMRPSQSLSMPSEQRAFVF